MEIEVLGAQQYALLARRLRDAADKGLQRELQTALTHATGPARQQVKDELPAYLPGGYAEDFGPTLRMRTAGRYGSGAGVRITAKAMSPRGRERFLGPLEAGTLRHPLFGMRAHWFTQDVHPHFFSQPITDSAPEIRRDLITAMDAIAEQIAD